MAQTPWLRNNNKVSDQEKVFDSKLSLIKSIDPIRSYGFEVLFFKVPGELGKHLSRNCVAFKQFQYKAEFETIIKQSGQTYLIPKAPSEKSFILEFDDVLISDPSLYPIYTILHLYYIAGNDSAQFDQEVLARQIRNVNPQITTVEQFKQTYQFLSDPIAKDYTSTNDISLPENSLSVHKLDGNGQYRESYHFYGAKITNLVQSDLDYYSTNSTSKIIATINFENLVVTYDYFTQQQIEYNSQSNPGVNGSNYSNPQSFKITEESTSDPTEISSPQKFKVKSEDTDFGPDTPNRFEVDQYTNEGVDDFKDLDVVKFKPKPAANTWQAKV